MNRFPPGVAHFLNRAVIHRLLRRIRLQEKIERDTLSALLLFILVVRSRAKRHRIHLLLVEIQQSNLWQCVHASLIEAREDPLLARIACRLVCEVCALDDLLPGSDLVLRVEIMSALTEIICESCEVRQAACEALIAITPPLNAAGRRKIHTHQVHKLMRLMTLELETSSRAYPEATIGLLSLLRWTLFPRKACGVNIYLCIQPLLTGAYLGQVVGLRIIYDNLETKLLSMVTAMHFPCRTGPGPLSQRSICEGTCTISASLSWLLVHASPDISRIASKILRLLPDYEKEAVSVLTRGGCAPILWLAENHECKTVRSTMFHTTRKISDCIKHHLLSLPPASRSPQLSVAINGAFGVLKIIPGPPPPPTCPPPTAHIFYNLQASHWSQTNLDVAMLLFAMESSNSNRSPLKLLCGPWCDVTMISLALTLTVTPAVFDDKKLITSSTTVHLTNESVMLVRSSRGDVKMQAPHLSTLCEMSTIFASRLDLVRILRGELPVLRGHYTTWDHFLAHVSMRRIERALDGKILTTKMFIK